MLIVLDPESSMCPFVSDSKMRLPVSISHNWNNCFEPRSNRFPLRNVKVTVRIRYRSTDTGTSSTFSSLLIKYSLMSTQCYLLCTACNQRHLFMCLLMNSLIPFHILGVDTCKLHFSKQWQQSAHCKPPFEVQYFLHYWERSRGACCSCTNKPAKFLSSYCNEGRWCTADGR